MQTIDLKKYYYPICRKETLVELTDEVADAIAEAARAENAGDAKQHYHCYSLDASPSIENHSPEQSLSPEDILMEEETEREQEAVSYTHLTVSQLPHQEPRRAALPASASL